MSSLVTSTVAALSAAAAVAGFFAYLYFARRADAFAASKEAFDLAETRRQVICELRERMQSEQELHSRAEADCEQRIRGLQATLEKARSQARLDAYEVQHFYAASLSELGKDLLTDLERDPPDVEGAVVRIRSLLTSGPATSNSSTV